MDIVKHEKTRGQQSDSQQETVRVPRVRLWTRLSPMYIFRVFRDTYVKGCVTFGNSSKVNAVAHATAYQISYDGNSFSRSNSRCVHDDVASAQELLDLSAKFSRDILEQESVQSGRKHLAAVITGGNGKILLCLSHYIYELEHQQLAFIWSTFVRWVFFHTILFCSVDFLTVPQYVQCLKYTSSSSRREGK